MWNCIIEGKPHFVLLIRRNIVYREKELIIPLDKTIVRPHLEYCIKAREAV